MAKPRKPSRSRTGDRRDTFKEAHVLIPLTFNDGTEVPRDTIDGLLDEVYDAFRGWTIEGTVKGAYRMDSGEKRVEDHLKVSIVLRREQSPLWSRWSAGGPWFWVRKRCC